MTMTRKVALLTIILSIANLSMGQPSDRELKGNKRAQGKKNKKLGRLKKNFKDEEAKLAQQQYLLAQKYEESLLKEQADLEGQKMGQKDKGDPPVPQENPKAQQDNGDLDIRFSKIVFLNQSVDTSLLPLTSSDYPLDMETAMWLRTSQCPSIIVPENCYECDMSFKGLIEAIGGEPAHPSRDPESPYWDELREVTRAQTQRRNNIDPKEIMPIAKIWGTFTIDEVAEAVHDEVRSSIFPYFEGELTGEDGVPDDLLIDIPLNSLEKAVNYTAYPEGSPMHPAWPAMHSAASSASIWLAVILNLSPEQFCQAKLVDYGVAYARTVAGVHFPDDNIAGLNLDQETIAAKMPEHLEQRYGSNPVAVREKIASLRFDWRDFLDSECAKNFRDYL